MTPPVDKQEYLLPAELTIYEVGEVYADLMALVDDTKLLNLDGSRIAEIDTAGIQLLLRMLNVYPCQQLQIVNASLVLVEAFEFLGVVWGVELIDE
ncbi:STAS domain-containing protein [Vibrio sp. T187]|uniref:STAS domain-containing protein n=1 Tax=Vibrio TaxID=662 RepID=UPI0010CA12C2|nr:MULTISPECIES: STAS domain-containing protein [Vibrio]MBW3694738.1 STAS domain-containing protein [Vibrio sp. T187]